MIGLEQETVVIADQDEEWDRVAVATIAELNQITAIDYIDKGWSGDKKYRISAANGTKYLLRITPEENAKASSALAPGSLGLHGIVTPMFECSMW